MIRSQYIRDIITLLLDEDGYDLLSKQADWLSEDNFEYTGSGVFVRFKIQSEGLKYRFNKDALRLNGVEVKSDEIDIAAEASIFLSGGFIDFLEIWSYGDIYPAKDPLHYTLKQAWKGGPNKSITR